MRTGTNGPVPSGRAALHPPGEMRNAAGKAWRRGREMSGRIVVGVDGSSSSKAALAWAVDQARLTGASVEAVIAWHYPVVVGGIPSRQWGWSTVRTTPSSP